jgi:hypothetical protein
MDRMCPGGRIEWIGGCGGWIGCARERIDGGGWWIGSVNGLRIGGLVDRVAVVEWIGLWKMILKSLPHY